jgi:hypothetical protein
MGCWPVSLEEMKLLLLNKKDILFFNKKLKYTFHKSTPTTQFVQRVQLLNCFVSAA